MAKNSKRRAWTPAQVRTLKTSRKKENARDEYRKDAKANGKRNTAKSVQHGIVARLACLIGTKFGAVRPKTTQSN